MDRPQGNSKQAVPPPRRRIQPVPVTQDGLNNAAASNVFNQPLVVPPAPAAGCTKDVSACGKGRRVFVDPESKFEVKWKEVLRQQGLDLATWRRDREQHRAQLDGDAAGQGANAKLREFTGRLAGKLQGMYNVAPDDEDAEEGEDDEEEDGSEPAEGAEEEEGDAAASSGEHDEEDDEDDEDDDKEGNDTGGEVDLEKEAEAEQARVKAKRKRQRFERYDDDFIDDSELEHVKVAAQAKTKFTGFYATEGTVETLSEAPKPRAKPRPRQPKNTDAAAGAAAGGTAGGAAAAASKKRKQPAQQQQPPPEQHHREAATADAAAKKKRKRSEAPAGAQDKLPAGKKAKASPAPSAAAEATAGAAAAVIAAALPGAVPPAPPAPTAAGGTAAKALAAVKAAARKKPPAAANKTTPADVAAPTPAAAAAAATAAAAAAAVRVESAAATAAPAAAEGVGKLLQQQQRQQPQQAAAAAAAPAGTPEPTAAGAAASGEAAAAAEHTAAAEAAAAAAAGGAVAAAEEAGFPPALVQCVEKLQHAVAEHKPAAPGTTSGAANMSKAVRSVFDALGMAFARLPLQVRGQQAGPLLSAVGPLMLPYMKEKKLKRMLLEDPAKKADELDSTKAALMAELEGALRQIGNPGGADAGSDEDFQAHLSVAAEDALLAAWNAALHAPDLLNQLALDVCAKLGWSLVQGSPTKAVAELKQVVSKAKKRQQKQRAAAAAALSSQSQSARQSPEPSAAAEAAPAAGRAGTPGPTPQKQAGLGSSGPQQVGLASIALAAAAGGAGVAGAAPAASQKHSQQQEKFSSLSAPSPRLQRCLDAAVAAGAPREWLQEKYPLLKTNHMHQVFRTLCVSGPAGCPTKDLVARAADHNLGFTLDDTHANRRALKQSLQSNTMNGIAGTTDAEEKSFALLCFPGVQKQPNKPPRPAADAQAAAGQQGTHAVD